MIVQTTNQTTDNTRQTLKVAEIFHTAGKAFTQIADLVADLQPIHEAQTATSKWSEAEISAIHEAVSTFSKNIYDVTSRIRAKQVEVTKGSLKRKNTPESSGGLSKQQASAVSYNQQTGLAPHKATGVVTSASRNAPGTSPYGGLAQEGKTQSHTPETEIMKQEIDNETDNLDASPVSKQPRLSNSPSANEQFV